MDVMKLYKKETGLDVYHTETTIYNALRTDDIYYDDYITWLEERIENCPKCSQQKIEDTS